MWTPKRVLILVGGFLLFLTGYGVYDFFLGGIDGLPPLPPDYGPTGEIYRPPSEDSGSDADKKLQQAFGPGCQELRRPIRLLLRDKGVALAAGQFDFEDGRVKFSPFSAAMFPKNAKPEAYPEINTVQCEVAYLTLDRPVSSPMEMANRKVTAVELRDHRGVVLINNRGSAVKSDDIEVRINEGPLLYEDRRNLIWTDGIVQLLDQQTQPHPTKVTARGMELRLAKDVSPNRPKAAKPPAAKKEDGPSGIELLVLRASVDMHLYVDRESGFLSGPDEFRKPDGKDRGKADEKAHVVIHTEGPFTYDLKKELAWFDTPPANVGSVPVAPEQVIVMRETMADGGKKIDQLTCDHLELQFRKKPTTPHAGSKTASSTGGKEIDWAVATCRAGKEVVLALDTQMMEAYGSEMHYRGKTDTAGPQTILKGTPVRAAKEGHKIVAPELHLTGADKLGNGQKMVAKGAGHIHMFDGKNPQHPDHTHIRWRDGLVSVKERDGNQLFDFITLTGDASFVDDETGQELHGQKLQVWVKQANPDAPRAAGPRQQLHKVMAFDNVKARSAEVIIRHANRLLIAFLPEVSSGDRLPDAVPLVKVSARPDQQPSPMLIQGAPPPALLPPTVDAPPVVASQPGPAKRKSGKPMELTANDVAIYVTTLGTRKQLQEMKAEGGVFVHQDGKNPGEKEVEIQGHLLTVHHHADGDQMFVYGEPKRLARLELGELKLWGPKVSIDQRTNKAEIDGTGAMDMPSNRGLVQGSADPPPLGQAAAAPAKPATRLTVHWTKNMTFDGQEANFYGGVQAFQEQSSLKCQDLTVWLDRRVSFKEGGEKRDQKAKVDKLVCNRKVYILDEKREGEKVVQATVIEGAELEMDNLQSETKVYGPGGRFRHLALGSSDLAGPAPAPPNPRAPKAPNQELKLTRIEYESRLFYKALSDRAKKATFYDNIHVYHFPADSLDAFMNADKPPKNGFYLHCQRLDVLTRQEEGHKTSQEMIAQRNVFFRTEEFFGYADVVKFNEASDTIIFEATEGRSVKLYKWVGPGVEPKEIKGKQVLYNRKKGEFTLSGGTVITSWLDPAALPPEGQRVRQDPPVFSAPGLRGDRLGLVTVSPTDLPWPCDRARRMGAPLTTAASAPAAGRRG